MQTGKETDKQVDRRTETNVKANTTPCWVCASPSTKQRRSGRQQHGRPRESGLLDSSSVTSNILLQCQTGSGKHK